MKKRSLGKMFLLFIVTLGIYRLYWFAKTRSEMLKLRPSLKIPSVWYLIIPSVIIAGVLIFFIGGAFSGAFQAATEIEQTCGYNTQSAAYKECADAITRESEDNTGALLITLYGSFIIFFPLLTWWLWMYCKAVEVVTKEKLAFPIAMLITLMVPDGVDILLVQDSFNKVKGRT